MLKYENVNLGLLLLRLGLGIAFIVHGLPKISAGPETWEKLGGAMGNIGIHFMPTFWGFMASLAECGGGVLIMLGVLWKPACFLLTFTLAIALIMHLHEGDGFNHYSESLETGIVFAALFFTGPGKYKVSK